MKENLCEELVEIIKSELKEITIYVCNRLALENDLLSRSCLKINLEEN